MYLLLDNHDSFVYNLKADLESLGRTVQIFRPEELTLAEVSGLQPEAIIISPGPGRPEEATFALSVLERFQGEIPILGVCLGFQVIAHAFGARVEKGVKPMQGKLSHLSHNSEGLFARLPEHFRVTRYHSLIASAKDFPESLQIDARSDEDGVIMAVSNAELKLYGLQFHPEAVLTEQGQELLQNFLAICEAKK